MGSGVAFVGAGLLVVVALPLPAGPAALAAAAWVAWSVVDLLRPRRGLWATTALCLHADGRMVLEEVGGSRADGRLLAGSIVLGSCAWLRLQADAGRPWGILVVRQLQDREQWRRFQVICRHLTA